MTFEPGAGRVAAPTSSGETQCDAARGNNAAVDRDVCCIDNLKYHIAIEEWLIRWNSLQYADFYPIRTNSVSRAAIAQAATPILVPYTRPTPPRPRTVTISITIVNAESAGAGVAFAINGVAHQAAAGSRQELAVAPDSSITYDSGGSLGQRRYLISAGRYEFRSTAEGWRNTSFRTCPELAMGPTMLSLDRGPPAR